MFVKFERKFGKPTVPVESAAFHLDTQFYHLDISVWNPANNGTIICSRKLISLGFGTKSSLEFFVIFLQLRHDSCCCCFQMWASISLTTVVFVEIAFVFFLCYFVIFWRRLPMKYWPLLSAPWSGYCFILEMYQHVWTRFT